MRLLPDAEVFLVLGSTDMRKAINGLSLMVAEQLERDVFSGCLFVFCNRGRTIIKVLQWGVSRRQKVSSVELCC